VNSREHNFTAGKVRARRELLDENVARYLAELDRASRDPALLPPGLVAHLKDKLTKVRDQMEALDAIEQQLKGTLDHQISHRSRCTFDDLKRARNRHCAL